jgi:hypothetical protein
MIEVNAINNNGVFSPESIPDSVGSFFDGKKYLFFETENEMNNYLNAIPIVFDIESFTNELSTAFDAKFETYWKAKGYSDINDLLSHAANPDSVCHAEALSLIQWSHNEWEAAIADINENTNIEEIINNLSVFE